METKIEEAAELRRQSMKQVRDRPSGRRGEAREKSLPVATSRLEKVCIREADDGSGLINFSGYASVTNRGYPMWDAFGPYTETVDSGAFSRTLSKNPDVPLVLGHDSMRRIARTTNGTLRLNEDGKGLAVDADLDPADHDVSYSIPKIRSGLYDEMSFRFGIDEGEWSEDFSEFNIRQVDLNRGDVSIVGYGANPFTSMSVRSLEGMEEDDLEALYKELLKKFGPKPQRKLSGHSYISAWETELRTV